MTPIISIISPVYNTEKHLVKSIKSTINQTFKKWELILVNDCSPDNSLEILNKYENKYSNIKVINQKINQGVDVARHTGIKESKGEFLMFLDSDDWLLPNALEVLYNKIIEEKSDIVCGSTLTVLDNYKIFKKNNGNSYFNINQTESIGQPKLFDEYYISYFGVNKLNVSMSGKLYRKETIQKANIKPGGYKMGEDLIFNMKLHPFLSKMSFVSDSIFCYRFGGMTATSNPTFLNDIKSQYKLKKEYIKKNNYEKALPFIQYELINCFYSHYLNLTFHQKLSSNQIKSKIEEELKDPIYKEITNVNDIHDVILVKKHEALKEHNVKNIITIIESNLKKTKKKYFIKKCFSKILSLF